MTNYQLSAVIALLRECANYLPTDAQNPNCGWIIGLKKRVEQQVAELLTEPGFNHHIKVNQLLADLENQGKITLDTLEELFDKNA